MPILLKEVFTLYEALAQGRTALCLSLAPVSRLHHWLQGQDMAAAEAYWRRTLAGFTAPVAISVAPVGVRSPAAGLRESERQPDCRGDAAGDCARQKQRG